MKKASDYSNMLEMFAGSHHSFPVGVCCMSNDADAENRRRISLKSTTEIRANFYFDQETLEFTHFNLLRKDINDD